MPRLGRGVPVRPSGGPHPAKIGRTSLGGIPAAGPPPTLVAAFQVNSAGVDLGTLTTPSFTPATDDVLVVKAVAADQTLTFGTPTGGGWTYSPRGDDSTAAHVRATMWTARVTAGGTPQTVAVTASGTAHPHTIVVEQWTAVQVAASPAVTDQIGSGAPSATNTTVGGMSVVSWCCGDWSAQDGRPAHTYRGATYETGFRWVTGEFGAYWAYTLTTGPGAQTVGVVTPAGQTWTLLAVELLGPPRAVAPVRLWQPVARAAYL